MDATPETISANGAHAAPRHQQEGRAAPAARAPAMLAPWLRTQAINVRRHAESLRPFRQEEFGGGAEVPSEGHIQAVNTLLESLRNHLYRQTEHVSDAVEQAIRAPTPAHHRQVLARKERAHKWVQGIERIWDFYFELFGQRQSQYGVWLLGCDRIARNCYQEAYTGLAVARPIPAPPPFAYMRTGFSPATFRRGIPLRRLGRQLNPFPLIQLPYHRLVNPWTLGAILHEVSHNIQNDLGLERAIPRAIALRILRAGYGRQIAAIWARWNRELFADVSGLLLGGPAVVGSLMDVIGRGPRMVLGYLPHRPHPTPYLRAFISIELLRRMGFPDEARQYRQTWMRLYPNPRSGSIPRAVLDSFPDVIPLVVDTVCFQQYPSLGNRSLAQVMRFAPKEQQMVEEAARRLSTGTDPGVIPSRFLIGATRFAFEQHLARPETIAENFYKELARR